MSPGTTLAYVTMLLRDRIWGAAPVTIVAVERAARIGVWLMAAGTVSYVGVWEVVLLFYWTVSLVTTAAWIGAWAELLEHYPFMETRPKISLYMTRNRLVGFVGRCLLGIHGENWHLIHHLYPTLPNWKFKEAHLLLVRVPENATLHVAYGLPAVLREMFREADTAVVNDAEVKLRVESRYLIGRGGTRRSGPSTPRR